MARTKIKTSLTLSRETLRQIKAIAKDQDRSVSNVLERFIKLCIEELDRGNRTPGRKIRL